MSEEIKVGEYIRTKSGNITKVISVKDTIVCTKDFIDVHFRYNEGIIKKTDILIHSLNIIDLVCEGDYINGYLVEKVKEVANEKIGKVVIYDTDNIVGYEFESDEVRKEDIKTIVTKEMFNKVKYEVKK